VLFDEVEKVVDSRVLDALLRFLDEGKIDDPAGPVRDGSQCVVVFTTNVGAKRLSELSTQVGDDSSQRTAIRTALREELEKHKFRVEFLNRVDEVLLFHTLNEADYAEIAERHLRKMLVKLEKERRIHVQVDPGVASSIGAYCSRISEGARAVKRLVRSVVLLPASRFVLKQGCEPPVRVRVKLAHGSGQVDTLAAEPVGEADWIDS
jgi:ATP-dependent Clp protease ATP-binding subunit ClpC